jgi:hypothetical protein
MNHENNPIDKVPHYRGLGHRRGSAPTLTADQCAEIMKWAEENHGGKLVPFIALCHLSARRGDLFSFGASGALRAQRLVLFSDFWDVSDVRDGRR